MNGWLLFGVSHVSVVPWMCNKPAFDFLKNLGHLQFPLFCLVQSSFTFASTGAAYLFLKKITCRSGRQVNPFFFFFFCKQVHKLLKMFHFRGLDWVVIIVCQTKSCYPCFYFKMKRISIHTTILAPYPEWSPSMLSIHLSVEEKSCAECRHQEQTLNMFVCINAAISFIHSFQWKHHLCYI